MIARSRMKALRFAIVRDLYTILRLLMTTWHRTTAQERTRAQERTKVQGRTKARNRTKVLGRSKVPEPTKARNRTTGHDHMKVRDSPTIGSDSDSIVLCWPTIPEVDATLAAYRTTCLRVAIQYLQSRDLRSIRFRRCLLTVRLWWTRERTPWTYPGYRPLPPRCQTMRVACRTWWKHERFPVKIGRRSQPTCLLRLTPSAILDRIRNTSSGCARRTNMASVSRVWTRTSIADWVSSSNLIKIHVYAVNCLNNHCFTIHAKLYTKLVTVSLKLLLSKLKNTNVMYLTISDILKQVYHFWLFQRNAVHTCICLSVYFNGIIVITNCFKQVWK